MDSGFIHAWNDFFVAEVGASATLAGLLFVSVSINLGQILKYPHLPVRALEALGMLLCVLVVSTFALVPAQTRMAYALETGATGLATWAIQTMALMRTNRSGYETPVRYLLNQVPPVPFVVAGVLLALGHPAGIYWVVPGALLCIASSVFSAWILLVEIQR
jgi:GTP:adenosylcobinamide-phosphate guanylyltransferase